MSEERTLFPIAMRGYDRVQVDQQIARLERAVDQSRRQIEAADARVLALQAELSAAHALVAENERPSYSGLGTPGRAIIALRRRAVR